MENTSQKPYSPSPSARSLRTIVLKTWSPDLRCTSTNEMKLPWWHSNEGGKNLDAAHEIEF
jgi:hypothetical protein